MRTQQWNHGTIYEGDCLELMHDILDGSIDMILADLPYGTTQNKWDIVIPFKPLWQHYERIIKQNGAIVLTAAEPFTSFLVVSNHKLFRYDLVWDKIGCSGFLNANKMPLRSHENILVFYKSLPVYNPQKEQRTRKEIRRGWKKDKAYTCIGKPFNQKGTYHDGIIRFPSDKLEIDKKMPKSIISVSIGNGHNKSEWIHSSQQPVELLEYLLRTYTNKGDTVLDNVIGSGTTAVAAFRTGRRWIGMEKDPEIFEKACARIEEDTRQQNLFA